jgi:hypothetical protein
MLNIFIISYMSIMLFSVLPSIFFFFNLNQHVPIYCPYSSCHWFVSKPMYWVILFFSSWIFIWLFSIYSCFSVRWYIFLPFKNILINVSIVYFSPWFLLVSNITWHPY